MSYSTDSPSHFCQSPRSPMSSTWTMNRRPSASSCGVAPGFADELGLLEAVGLAGMLGAPPVAAPANAPAEITIARSPSRQVGQGSGALAIDEQLHPKSGPQPVVQPVREVVEFLVPGRDAGCRTGHRGGGCAGRGGCSGRW